MNSRGSNHPPWPLEYIPMISAQTSEQLLTLLSTSVSGCVTSLSGVHPVSTDDWMSQQHCEDARLIMLTLSGYNFRSLICLSADNTEATTSMDDDHLQELANNLCGTFKRQLSQSIPELGMSTPSALPLGCVAYLQEDGAPALAVRCVDANGIVLHACMVPLQVGETWSLSSLELNKPEPQALGELELF